MRHKNLFYYSPYNLRLIKLALLYHKVSIKYNKNVKIIFSHWLFEMKIKSLFYNSRLFKSCFSSYGYFNFQRYSVYFYLINCLNFFFPKFALLMISIWYLTIIIGRRFCDTITLSEKPDHLLWRDRDWKLIPFNSEILKVKNGYRFYLSIL